MVQVGGVWYLFTDGVNGANNIALSGAEVPPSNTWSHVAFTFDGAGAWRYYLNGTLTKSGTFAVPIATGAATSFTLGDRLDVSGQTFHGRLDEVALYPVALSAERVAAHYHAGTTATTTFVYNGDGELVATQVSGPSGTTTTHYVAGGLFEKNVTTGAAKSYYRFGGRLVAVRDSATGLHYLHQDHLGSTSLQTSGSGAFEGSVFRGPFGQPWLASGALATDFQYTGQRSFESGLGSLDFYQSRWYSPVLGRFLQPDTIVPTPANPQDLNRYTYVDNNPLRYTDPTGHDATILGGRAAQAALWVAAAALTTGYEYGWGPDAAANREALVAPVAGAINFAGKAKDALGRILGDTGGQTASPSPPPAPTPTGGLRFAQNHGGCGCGTGVVGVVRRA